MGPGFAHGFAHDAHGCAHGTGDENEPIGVKIGPWVIALLRPMVTDNCSKLAKHKQISMIWPITAAG